jgi:threonine efflux protein
MRYVPDLAVLSVVWFLVVIAPGPNFLTAVSAATTRGRRHGVQVALGFAVGDAIWAASSILGLAVLLARYGWLSDIVRFGGAAVLCVLGARSLLHARTALTGGVGEATEPTALPKTPRRFRSGVVTGLLVDLGNPKAAIFFTSLFAALLPAAAPWWLKIATIAVTAAIPACWYCLVAYLFSTGRVAAAYRRLRRPLDALAGTLFIAVGLRLATSG